MQEGKPMSETTGQTPLDNFHSDELRAELARRGAITEEAVQLYKNLTQSTAREPVGSEDA